MGDGLKKARAAARATREGAFKAGDHVTIHDHYEGPAATRKIVAATPMKATDSLGEEWRNEEDGRQYGCGRDHWYTGRRIRRFEIGDAATVRARRLRIKIRAVKWENVPLEMLEAVASLLALDAAKVPDVDAKGGA